MSEAFKDAMKLLAIDPLPSDAEVQLSALEKKIDADERDRFGDLWEAYYAALDEFPSEF